jgi:hypothetical protein
LTSANSGSILYKYFSVYKIEGDHMRYSKMVLALFPLLFGCATIGGLHPGTGYTFEINNKTYNQVWKAAVTVVGRSLTIVESNKNTGVLKAEKGAGISTWGEVVGVFITPADTSSTQFTVEVTSLKRSMLQITGQNWESTIIEGMKAELDL